MNKDRSIGETFSRTLVALAATAGPYLGKDSNKPSQLPDRQPQVIFLQENEPTIPSAIYEVPEITFDAENEQPILAHLEAGKTTLFNYAFDEQRQIHLQYTNSQEELTTLTNLVGDWAGLTEIVQSLGGEVQFGIYTSIDNSSHHPVFVVTKEFNTPDGNLFTNGSILTVDAFGLHYLIPLAIENSIAGPAELTVDTLQAMRDSGVFSSEDTAHLEPGDVVLMQVIIGDSSQQTPTIVSILRGNDIYFDVNHDPIPANVNIRQAPSTESQILARTTPQTTFTLNSYANIQELGATPEGFEIINRSPFISIQKIGSPNERWFWVEFQNLSNGETSKGWIRYDVAGTTEIRPSSISTPVPPSFKSLTSLSEQIRTIHGAASFEQKQFLSTNGSFSISYSRRLLEQSNISSITIDNNTTAIAFEHILQTAYHGAGVNEVGSEVILANFVSGHEIRSNSRIQGSVQQVEVFMSTTDEFNEIVAGLERHGIEYLRYMPTGTPPVVAVAFFQEEGRLLVAGRPRRITSSTNENVLQNLIFDGPALVHILLQDTIAKGQGTFNRITGNANQVYNDFGCYSSNNWCLGSLSTNAISITLQ